MIAARYSHRFCITLYAVTLFFTLCGLFLVPFGQHYLSKILVLSSIVGVINYFFGGEIMLGWQEKNYIYVF